MDNEKYRLVAGMIHYVMPVSRILYHDIADATIVIYLGVQLLVRSSGTFATLAQANTALHSNKDFAVSISPFDEPHPEGAVGFRLGRLCSHLLYYYRWALPTILPPH